MSSVRDGDGFLAERRRRPRRGEHRHRCRDLRRVGRQRHRSSVGQAASAAPQRVREQTQGNPLAAGLIAFGAGWLLASLRGERRRAAHRRAGRGQGRPAGRAGQAAGPGDRAEPEGAGPAGRRAVRSTAATRPPTPLIRPSRRPRTLRTRSPAHRCCIWRDRAGAQAAPCIDPGPRHGAPALTAMSRSSSRHRCAVDRRRATPVASHPRDPMTDHRRCERCGCEVVTALAVSGDAQPFARAAGRRGGRARAG